MQLKNYPLILCSYRMHQTQISLFGLPVGGEMIWIFLKEYQNHMTSRTMTAILGNMVLDFLFLFVFKS